MSTNRGEENDGRSSAELRSARVSVCLFALLGGTKLLKTRLHQSHVAEHRRMGSVRIAPHNRVDNKGVLAMRAARTPFQLELGAAERHQPPTHRRGHFGEHFVMRARVEHGVERLVRLGKGMGIPAMRDGAHLFVKGLQPAALKRRHREGREASTAGFEFSHRDKQNFQLCWRNLGHDSTATRTNLDQPAARQVAQGLSYRSARNFEQVGKLLFVEPGTRSEVPINDRLGQALCNFFGSRAGHPFHSATRPRQQHGPAWSWSGIGRRARYHNTVANT